MNQGLQTGAQATQRGTRTNVHDRAGARAMGRSMAYGGGTVREERGAQGTACGGSGTGTT